MQTVQTTSLQTDRNWLLSNSCQSVAWNIPLLLHYIIDLERWKTKQNKL